MLYITRNLIFIITKIFIGLLILSNLYRILYNY